MIEFIEATLIIAMIIFTCVFGFIAGNNYVSLDLHKAVDSNKTIREFYYEKYPNSYKKYYTDWKTLRSK